MKSFSDSHTEKACLATAILRRDALIEIANLTDEVFYNDSQNDHLIQE